MDVKLLICEKLNSEELMEPSRSIVPGLAMAEGHSLNNPLKPQKLFILVECGSGNGLGQWTTDIKISQQVFHQSGRSTDHCISASI